MLWCSAGRSLLVLLRSPSLLLTGFGRHHTPLVYEEVRMRQRCLLLLS
jgi:hypothetical protein